MVFPVVMYGSETWTIKKADRRRIDAFELWCWRRLLRVPWTARRTNLSILHFYSCSTVAILEPMSINSGKVIGGSSRSKTGNAPAATTCEAPVQEAYVGVPSLPSWTQITQTSPPPSPPRRENKQVDTEGLGVIPEESRTQEIGVDTRDLTQVLKELTLTRKGGGFGRKREG